MSNERFSEFRSGVERQTVLPEFNEVMDRARRHRRRKRLGTTTGAIAAVIVLMPALIYGGLVLSQGSGRPSLVQISIADGDSDGNLTTTVTQPSPGSEISARLIAAGGVDLAHSYGLVDACSANTCSLQLVSLSPPLTKRIGLLRTDPSQVLANPHLVALDDLDVVVSADVGESIAPQYQTYNLGPIFPDRSSRPAQQSDVPVQTSTFGAIGVVTAGDGKVGAIARQPDLTSPQLASTIRGWWVTGADARTGELAVSVTRDEGATWHTSSLGVIPDRPPALATQDGRKVYVLVHSAGQMLLIRSSDGGTTWSAPTIESAWNSYVRYGVMTPRDGSVGVWLATKDDEVSFCRSTDGGATFTPVIGPYAPHGDVVSLPGGYVTLGAQPAISTDGRSWTTIKLPVVPPR